MFFGDIRIPIFEYPKYPSYLELCLIMVEKHGGALIHLEFYHYSSNGKENQVGDKHVCSLDITCI